MRRILTIMLVTYASVTWATTYYVSSSTGDDANAGTSTSVPWKTIAHVNGQTFQPGDSILFKRGDVWNESLSAWFFGRVWEIRLSSMLTGAERRQT